MPALVAAMMARDQNCGLFANAFVPAQIEVRSAAADFEGVCLGLLGVRTIGTAQAVAIMAVMRSYIDGGCQSE